MLDSLEIEDGLLDMGFQLSKARSYAREFTHPALLHPVYLKANSDGKNADRLPVKSNPLVFHPQLASDLEVAAAQGLVGPSELVHNTCYSLFPKRLNGGRTPISFGRDVGVENNRALRQLFAHLFGNRFEEADVDSLLLRAAEDDIDAGLAGRSVSPTTRTALIEARVGQGKYRKDLMDIWGGQCAVSGCSIQTALIASHAVPWSENKDPAVCLDPYNGLLLSASIDRLFDRGLISFADEGQMRRKPEISDEQLEKLGLSPAARLRFVPIRLRVYLAAHRKRFKF